MNVLRLTLRQLQIFVAVARSGSTMAAAAEIALSQSATSAALNELERLLSLQLFDRSGKRLRLNDNGRALLPRAQALLDGAGGIEAMARDSAGQSGSLRIGASTTIGNYVLPALLDRFYGNDTLGSSPAWRSRITIGNTEAICDALAAFELDVGLIEGPTHQPMLEVVPWLLDELVLVAAPHRMPSGTGSAGRVPLKRLRDAVWLLREAGSGTRETTDQLLLPHLRGWRRSIELGSSEAIKRAAAHGIGIACLSHWVVDDMLQSGALMRIESSLPRMQRECYVAVHRDKQPTAALLRFVEVARGEQAANWAR